MWFNRQKQVSKAATSEDCTQSKLARLYSNGIDLSMQELLQYQSKSNLIDLKGKKNIQGKQAGNYLSRSKGRGMEFDEVRHYQTGDDVRAIDWRVTARTGKTHTKLFREEIERPVLVATDLSPNMRFGSKLLFKSVQAAHLAALVAWHAKARGDRLGGLVFSGNKHIELKPRSRKAGVLHYLHALTTLNNQKESTTEQETNASPTNQAESTPTGAVVYTNDFEHQCARLRHIAKPGSLVYLITDGHSLLNTQASQHALRHLTQISQHCELVVCLINDPLELTLPESTMKLSVTFTDGKNRQQLTLGDTSTLKKYQEQALNQTNLLEQQLVKTGARIIQFSAGETLEQQLKSSGAIL